MICLYCFSQNLILEFVTYPYCVVRYDLFLEGLLFPTFSTNLKRKSADESPGVKKKAKIEDSDSSDR